MVNLIKACTDPITDITGPLYHLAKGNSRERDQLYYLILAAFRTATVAGLFFVIIPFNRIFGSQDTLSGSLAFATQWLIHPYAAALFNAYINGGRLLVIKAIDIVFKRQLILTRGDIGGFARAIAFCFIARCLKNYTNVLDFQYLKWSSMMADFLKPNKMGNWTENIEYYPTRPL
jgi:hypothetical protein